MKKIKVKKIERKSIFLIVMSLVLLAYSITLLFPLLWSVFSSFKHPNDFSSDPFGIMTYNGLSFNNYLGIFEKVSIDVLHGNEQKTIGILDMLYNSLFYCFGVSLVANTTRSLVAYVCARYKHVKFTKIIYGLVIVLMTVSFPGNLAVTIKYYKLVGIYDNMYMAVLLSISFSGSNFLFMYAAYVGLSMEYSEAAQIDGANQFQVMFKVMMPMVKNIFVALVMLEFVAHWNDYTPNVVFLSAYPMLSYGLYSFQHSLNPSYAIVEQFSVSFLVMIPTLIIFIIFRNRIMSNLAIGGLKG